VATGGPITHYFVYIDPVQQQNNPLQSIATIVGRKQQHYFTWITYEIDSFGDIGNDSLRCPSTGQRPAEVPFSDSGPSDG
jgi:hypothetical protein